MSFARMPEVALSALSLLVLAPVSNADLGAGLRKLRGVQNTLPMEPVSSPVVVPLQRIQSRSVDGGHASFYVGNIAVGEPAQKFSVMFDTSSGHVLLPHRACSKPACLEHARYSPWESATAMDINPDGKMVEEGRRLVKGNVTRHGVSVEFTQADLGEGEAKSVVVRDHVCIGSKGAVDGCVDVALLAAVSLEDAPFRAMPNDGIIGLGLESLGAGPTCSFFGQFLKASKNLLPQFGISFGVESGEVYFGGHDTTRFVEPLRWFPVDHPEQGFWQVAIQGVRVNGVVIDSCSNGCHGIIDTGASRLGVQASRMKTLNAALAPSVFTDAGCQGPVLTFDLGGFELKLDAQGYTDAECIPQLGSLNIEEPTFVGVYAFGETVLRRYYAAFDWEARRIGFAPTVANVAQNSDKAMIV